MRPMKFGFGQPVRRVEDHRLTTGTGRYTDDTAVEGALHAFVLRSQYAHATFKVRDKDVARKMKGVKLILTGEDVAHLGDIPCKGLIKTTSGENVEPLPVPVLPTDTVRHVGEAVAFIVAETLDQARDAAEAIDIECTTPVINYPEVAIVGVNKMMIRPVWDGTTFVPRKMMNLSCSFDHRVIDGWDAAVFVQRLKELIETPATLFVDI